eukprot:CAMPEP_0115083510 /NCGR_PEP_ID=MMETSP0227-20121206/20605_1 /TAXON_ID=89957 /ORGANISM="Polarella glacialis, Strain CCMP 1383" /LENGTH=32 /DNA_ID= /DNA_START= /DNA_END= /DNA_ORIENTATION=
MTFLPLTAAFFLRPLTAMAEKKEDKSPKLPWN